MKTKSSTKHIYDEIKERLKKGNVTGAISISKLNLPVASEQLIKASELQRNLKPQYDEEKDLYKVVVPEDILKMEHELLNKENKHVQPFYPPEMAPSKESMESSYKKLAGITTQYDKSRGMYYYVNMKPSSVDPENEKNVVNLLSKKNVGNSDTQLSDIEGSSMNRDYLSINGAVGLVK